MNNAESGSGKADPTRRDFLELLAASGAIATFSAGSVGAIDPDPNELSTYMIEATEKLFGLEFTEEIRTEILPDLKELLAKYLEIRKLVLEAYPPAMVFNPIPAGKQIAYKKKKSVFSEVEAAKPKEIEDVAFFSIPQLAHLLRTRQITALQLTKMYLSRLKKYDSTLSFVVNLTEKLALKQARKADKEIRKGNYRGLLHGIPYGIKDLFAVKGYPTTWGVKIYKNRTIKHTASVVEKLEKAGAILIAKLATGRLASGDEWYDGKTRNPWNPKTGSSGSSAGPASATAAGCVGFAIGTETNGSMVRPCHTCGVSGLSPTFGRVSRHGSMSVGWGWDKVAPICRTVEGLATVFDAIYGPDGKDNSIIDLPFNWDTNMDISGLRLGYYKRYFKDELLADPGDPKSVEHALKLRDLSKEVLSHFKKQGMRVRPIKFKFSHPGGLGTRHEPLEGIGMSLLAENAAAFDQFTRENKDELIPQSDWPRIHRVHRFVPAVEYIQADRYRNFFLAEMNNALQKVDVMIEIVTSTNFSQNVAGLPSVVVPCGFIDGMPAGIAFVGNLFEEDKVLAVAKNYQQATNHHLLHPDI